MVWALEETLRAHVNLKTTFLRKYLQGKKNCSFAKAFSAWWGWWYKPEVLDPVNLM